MLVSDAKMALLLPMIRRLEGEQSAEKAKNGPETEDASKVKQEKMEVSDEQASTNDKSVGSSSSPRRVLILDLGQSRG